MKIYIVSLDDIIFPMIYLIFNLSYFMLKYFVSDIHLELQLAGIYKKGREEERKIVYKDS